MGVHTFICCCGKTGKITAEELVEHFGMSYQQARMEISLVDSDNDGAVCLPEYMQMRYKGGDFTRLCGE